MNVDSLNLCLQESIMSAEEEEDEGLFDNTLPKNIHYDSCEEYEVDQQFDSILSQDVYEYDSNLRSSQKGFRAPKKNDKPAKFIIKKRKDPLMALRLPSVDQIKKQKNCDYNPTKKKGNLLAINKIVKKVL